MTCDPRLVRLRLGCYAAKAGVGAALDALSRCGQYRKRVARDVCLTGLVACLLFLAGVACTVLASIEAQLARDTECKETPGYWQLSGFDEDAGFDSIENSSHGYDSTVELRRLTLCISIGYFHQEVWSLEGQDEVGRAEVAVDWELMQ